MSTEHAKKPTTIETATVEVAVSCRRAAWWGVGAGLMLAGVVIAGFAVGVSSSPDSPFPPPPLPVPFAPPPPSADAPVLCSPAKYDANVLTGKVSVYRRGAKLKPMNETLNNEDLLKSGYTTTTFSSDTLENVDWREKDSPIKNQGDCESCWAHAFTEVMEWHLYNQTGMLGRAIPDGGDGLHTVRIQV